MYKKFFKSIIDVVFAFLALVILFPFLFTITICLYFANKGAGVFFVQERPGKNCKIIKVIKFKTMTDERGKDGKLLSDFQRLTKIGKFVRSLSIDELPQLINILKGDMSFIGPRPLLIKYLALYSQEQKHRHDVKPGLSGWAQVNGRNTISWSSKFEYDVWYVNNVSAKVDLKILLITIKKVVCRADVNSITTVTTMEPFNGSN